MENNFLGISTMNFIWNHPNSREHKIQSVSKFVGWQVYMLCI